MWQVIAQVLSLCLPDLKLAARTLDEALSTIQVPLKNILRREIPLRRQERLTKTKIRKASADTRHGGLDRH